MESLYKIFLLVKKDLKIEFQSKSAITLILVFAILTLFTIGTSLGNREIEPYIKIIIFWIIILFSSLSGLSYSFIKEEETNTITILNLTTEANIIYLSKLLFNIIILFIILLIIVPIFLIFIKLEIKNFYIFFLTLFLGSLCISSGCTITAALSSKSSGKSMIFAIISFPIILPILLLVISLTNSSLTSSNFTIYLIDFTILLLYILSINFVATILYEHINK